MRGNSIPPMIIAQMNVLAKSRRPALNCARANETRAVSEFRTTSAQTEAI
jgi:hypothetical protein